MIAVAGMYFGHILSFIIIKYGCQLVIRLGVQMKRRIPSTLFRGLVFCIIVAATIIFGIIIYGKELKLEDSHFKMLEYPRHHSTNNISKHWKKMALKLHPDRGGDREKFSKCNSAISILKDSNRRKYYDRFHIVDNFEEEHEKILKHAWEIIVEYLGWIALCFPALPNDKSLNTRTRTLLLLIILFFLDVYNSSPSRREGTLDPLDFIVPYWTLYQRGKFILKMIPAICILNYLYIYSFTSPWLNNYQQMMIFATFVLKQLSRFDNSKSSEYTKQLESISKYWETMICNVFGQKPIVNASKSRGSSVPQTNTKYVKRDEQVNEEEKGNIDTNFNQEDSLVEIKYSDDSEAVEETEVDKRNVGQAPFSVKIAIKDIIKGLLWTLAVYFLINVI